MSESSSDRDILREAGDALVARVKTNHRRVLTFGGLPPDMAAEIYGLTQQRSAKHELVVLVDAHEGTRAQDFVDSLFPGGTHGKTRICSGLSSARVRVICLTSEENVAGRINHLEFGHWLISAAGILLRQHFPETGPELESCIAEQRKAGTWSRSPGCDPDSYGFWPSRFPIFAIDGTSAAKQFSSVLRCLLHPGLMAVLIDAPEPEELVSEAVRQPFPLARSASGAQAAAELCSLPCPADDQQQPFFFESLQRGIQLGFVERRRTGSRFRKLPQVIEECRARYGTGVEFVDLFADDDVAFSADADKVPHLRVGELPRWAWVSRQARHRS